MFAKIWHNFKQIDYRYHIMCAHFMRWFVIQYGSYHDRHFSVPYTDIDYKVFTDAARHVLNYTSPYERHTYRYTPLIAILLTPNILIHECCGKLLFTLVDLAVALLIRSIVKYTLKEYECYKQKQDYKYLKSENKLKLTHPEEKQTGKRQGGGRHRKKHKNVDVKKTELEITADLSMLLWLYNPMTIAIATRGNCDSIAGMIVLITLYFLQCKHQPFYAGIFHGIAIHVRLYPLMYSLALFMHLSKFSYYSADYRRQKIKKERKVSETEEKASSKNEQHSISDSKTHKRNKHSKKSHKQSKTSENRIVKAEVVRAEKSSESKNNQITAYQDNKKDKKTIFKKEYLLYVIPNFDQIKLILGTIISLSILTGIFYLLYGYQFLYESYIYHLVRKDTRHNFSLYFYLQYLTAGIKNIGIWQKLLTILPQVILLLVFSLRYGLNKLTLNFAILTLTIVMVSYNTVLTSQYFIWILAVLPLCLWQIKMSKKMVFALTVIWFTAQVAWLLPAYLLEFHGHNTFLYIWAQSVSFFCANMAILGRFIKNFMPIRDEHKI